MSLQISNDLNKYPTFRGDFRYSSHQKIYLIKHIVDNAIYSSLFEEVKYEVFESIKLMYKEEKKGPFIASDEKGNLYTAFGSHAQGGADHVEAMLEGYQAYKVFGIKVPKTKMYCNQERTFFCLMVEWLPKTYSLGNYMLEKNINVVPEWIRKEVKKGFSVDAMLANWDVIDGLFNNICITNEGDVIRTNIRSIFYFRAQGDKKTFSSEVKELVIMRKSELAKLAKLFFHDITKEELIFQSNHIENVIKNLNKILSNKYLHLVTDRAMYLINEAKILTTVSEKKVTEEKTQVFRKNFFHFKHKKSGSGANFL